MKTLHKNLMVGLIFLICIYVAFSYVKRKSSSAQQLPNTMTKSLDPKSKQEIESLIFLSQDFEIEVYKRPELFKEDMLDQYWISAPEPGSDLEKSLKEVIGKKLPLPDREEVIAGVGRLRQEGWHYADTSCIREPNQKHEENARRKTLKILSVEALSSTVAQVKTYEHWYCPVHDANHNRVERRSAEIGPYNNEYIVCKRDGRWFVFNSLTPRPRKFLTPKFIAAVLVFGGVVTAFLWFFFFSSLKRMAAGWQEH